MEGTFGLTITEWGMMAVFIIAVIAWGFRMHGGATTMSEAFLAGRKVPGFIASLSTVATNLNGNDFLGGVGMAYGFGLVAIHGFFFQGFTLIFVSLVVIHRLRALNVYSLGGWLEHRYSPVIGNAYSYVWTFIWMLFNLGLYIYAGALVMQTLLGWDLYISIALLSFVAAFYTLLGGLGAVVATDVLQVCLMFFPLTFVAAACYFKMDGLTGLAERLPTDSNNMWAWHTPFGILPLMFAGRMCLGTSYWATEAQVVQRPLSAKDPDAARVSYMGASLWYIILVPFVIVLPGLTAAVLFPNLASNDHAMPMLIQEFLPRGLYGVAIVGLTAGFLSSADSQINAFCTMFTADVYRRHIARDRDDRHYLFASKVAGVIFTLCAIGTALLVSTNSQGMMVFAVGVLATIMPPFGAITVMGALFPRMHSLGALVGLCASGVVAVGLVFASQFGLLARVAEVDMEFRALITFVVACAVIACVSYAFPRPENDTVVEGPHKAIELTPLSLRYTIAILVVILVGYVFWTISFS